MDKNTPLKFSQLNEYGEISIAPENERIKKPKTPWQPRFLKSMIVLLLIVSFLIIILKK